MSLPTATTPGTDGPFLLTLSDSSTYRIPASFKPDTLTPGEPADEVGRAPGATSWIRHGPGGRRAQALQFQGRLHGSDASAQLTELRSKVRDAVSITYDNGNTITLESGDVNAKERRSMVIDVTIVLQPETPGGFV